MTLADFDRVKLALASAPRRSALAPVDPEAWAAILAQRGVRSPCQRCQGLGVRWYSSGSTWRGGMGTTMAERDVCDGCWGSGDADKPWPDRREEGARAERMAAQRLDTALGSLPVEREALAEFLARAVKTAERRDALALGVCQARALLRLLRGG